MADLPSWSNAILDTITTVSHVLTTKEVARVAQPEKMEICNNGS